MSVTSYDGHFSLKQDSIARLGHQEHAPLSKDQAQQLDSSPFMRGVRQAEELCSQLTSARDEMRLQTDPSFKPQDSDFSAPKSHQYSTATNYYQVLGIGEYAPLEEVKKAYKKLSLVYHPDKTSGLTPEQKEEYNSIFIELKNAYQTLSDNPTRRQYDRDRDREKASFQVSGFRPRKRDHFDAREVLHRISEMQKPPGQTVVVDVKVKLEKFFHGSHKAVSRERGVITPLGFKKELRTYRIDIPAGAVEPYECSFRRLGDHHEETQPDNLTFRITSKTHCTVERRGDDLVGKQPLGLAGQACSGPYLSFQAPSVRGRHLLFWGRNPFHHAPGNGCGSLQVQIEGEGMTPRGSLYLTCRMSRRSGAGGEGTLGKWREAGASEPASAPPAGERPSLKRFFQRHRLALNSGVEAPGSESEEEYQQMSALKQPALASTAAPGGEQNSTKPAMLRRLSSWSKLEPVCDLRMAPLGEPFTLFTKPTCSMRFYSNLKQGRQGTKPGFLSAEPMFALALSAPLCGKKAAADQWESLKCSLVPAAVQSAFRLLRAAREILPQPLADFAAMRGSAVWCACMEHLPVPTLPSLLRRSGNDAFRRGDTFSALTHYSRCLELLSPDCAETAIVLSNQAACLAQVQHYEASLEAAHRAVQLRPTWSRPWSRVGLAALRLGREEEALEAYFASVEHDATCQHMQALAAVASRTQACSTDTAHAEKEKGNKALRAKAFSRAVAHYTLSLAFVPGPSGGELVPNAFLLSVLHCNRAAALCWLGRWSLAEADARQAVRLKEDFGKAHSRLGVALLGCGRTEEAYAALAKALQKEQGDPTALRAREACMGTLPMWSSPTARHRFRQRFGTDLRRPSGSSKVYCISDVHFGHRCNEDWAHRIDDFKFREDVLIIAGNIADTRTGLMRALRTFKSKFRRVFFVPGNHEMALQPTEKQPDSLAKLLAIQQDCDELEVDVFPAAVAQDVFIVPLLSWYNAQFDSAEPYPDPAVQFDEHCRWPLDSETQLWKYMMKLNEAHLRHPYYGTVITCSHFLPLHHLPFNASGKAAKAMGCADLDSQVQAVVAKNRVHVYGHSIRRCAQNESGIWYVNHYHGEEGGKQDRAPVLLVYDGKAIVKRDVEIYDGPTRL